MADRIVPGAAYGTAVCTVLASFTLNDLAVVVGILATLTTMGANLWFQWDKRRREINAATNPK